MKILDLNVKILKFFSFWPFDQFTRTINILIKLFYFLIIDTSANAVTAAVIYQCLNGLDDITVLLEAIIGLGDYVAFRFMYFCFVNSYKDIEKLIEDFNIFTKFCKKEIIIDAEKKAKFFTKWSAIYFTLGLFINAVVPLFNMTKCRDARGSDYYREHDPCGMSVRNWYPFNANNPKIFPIVFLLQFCTCICIALGALSVSMCLIGLLIHVLAQLRNLRQFGLEMYNGDDELVIESKIHFFIEYHISIINYTQRIIKCFSLILFIYITLPSILISVLGYQIILSTNTTDRIRYNMHIAGWIGLLFMVCYYGQRLIDECEALTSVYNSKWYNSRPNLQKYTSIVLLRVQKPLKLEAASLSVMSLVTFVSVMKSAYSYFALLWTVTQQN